MEQRSFFSEPALNLSRIQTRPKTGLEPFHSNEALTGITLSDFWRWSTSDLASNATIGVLAEFIIAQALGVPLDQPRDEWAPWDLTTPEGIKVEVKSAAYLQSWNQSRLSTISFSIRKTRAWDAESNRQSDEIKRQADVYVLALLHHQDKSTLDPLNFDQWTFFVLPTSVLNGRKRSQHSITLPSLRRLHGPGIRFAHLQAAVLQAHQRNFLSLQQEQWFDLKLHQAYFDQFGQPIPVGPWHGETAVRTAYAEARRALAGERGPISSSEFPYEADAYPPGVEA